jgi:RimJ/RimL family protein N-acetyltransferase
MVFPEKNVLLKNGSTATFRSPTPEDATAMLAFLKNTAAETENLIRYPEECLTDIPVEKDFLRGICQSGSNMMIVCEMDRKIIGNCHLWYTPRIKLRHRGEVAIALLKKYWGLGIGSIMFEEIITQARVWELDHLCLSYIEGNDRARRLYEKVGFREVARIPDVYRLKDGSMRQDIWMMKKL